MKNKKNSNKYNFHLLQVDDLESFYYITKWDNDPDIAHLIIPNFKEEPLRPVSSLVLQVSYERNKNKEIYMISKGDKIVGSVSIDMNPEHLARKDEPSAWLGIVIGDKEHRGKGAGRVIMDFVEKRARELGATRMELGVFAFNDKAIRFYEKMGYERFHTIEDFTFYNGKWHDDYRMEKKL